MQQSKNKVIYLIRHAQSVYNVKEHELITKFKQLQMEELQKTPQYLSMKFEQKTQDCDITQQIGSEQCRGCRQKMNNIELDLIIVSPMRRALSTCAQVFKDHKSRAPIIVDPIFRQIFQSKCDIGSRLRQSMKDYPTFDYSLIKNVDYWYIQTMLNVEERNRIIQELQKTDEKDRHSRAHQLMLEYIKDLWRRRTQDPIHKKQALSPVNLQKQKLKILLQTYNSIAIVTHSQNIKSYCGIKPPNAQIMLYKPQYLQMQLEQVLKIQLKYV